MFDIAFEASSDGVVAVRRPAIGYARSSLDADRISQFLLLMYGHAANYQGRGSFFSTEQQSLYQDQADPSWRASLGESARAEERHVVPLELEGQRPPLLLRRLQVERRR